MVPLNHRGISMNDNPSNISFEAINAVPSSNPLNNDVSLIGLLALWSKDAGKEDNDRIELIAHSIGAMLSQETVGVVDVMRAILGLAIGFNDLFVEGLPEPLPVTPIH
jgi:hypothetical protein